MKTLVIPDIHNRVGHIELLIETVRPDRTVFLGDYFDSYDDDHHDAQATAVWLNYSLQQPNRIHLFGNHDLPYAYPWNKAVWCPGWTPKKNKAVNKVMERQDWDKMQLVHEEQGWLLSHAGFHVDNFAHPVNGISVESILADCATARKLLDTGACCRFLRQGSSMGESGVGGCTWLRWYELEAIPSINQIVAHTAYPEVQQLIRPTSKNYCLDTFSRYYGLIEDGEFSFHGNILVR